MWAQLLVMFGALLLMASGGGIVAMKLAIREVSKNVHEENLLNPGKKISIKGEINILLVGIDPREQTNDARADSIIIMHVPASHDRAYLVSLPRDARVTIPPFAPSKFQGSRNEKINAAFYYGSQNGAGRAKGFTLLANTITSFSGIRFHAGAIVDFNGFAALARALGGVDMCIDMKVTSIHIGTKNGKFAVPYTQNGDNLYPNPGVTPKVYTPACPKHLQPWEALDYVRQRKLMQYPDGRPAQGDYDRQRHQQQFVKAVITQSLKKGLTNPTKVKPIIEAAGKAVTVDLNGVSMETWIDNLAGIRDITMVKSNGGRFNSKVINGVDYEILSPDTYTLLRAAATDDVDTFLAQHPDWVSK